MLLKKTIPWTYMMGKIKVEIVLVIVYSLLIAVWHQELDINHITIPLAIPAILGTIISLLLAFRSNQAYDRWWEARIIWGAIVNDSRSLIRQMQTFLHDRNDADETYSFMQRFANRQIGWVYSLGRSLRGQRPIEEADGFFAKEEKEWALHSTNVPNALLSLHGRDIRTALRSDWINAYQQVELNQTITKLCDAMGKCERIKNTVFPTTYSVYIHFAICLFILLLPFGLTASLGFIQVPLVVCISGTFLLIEKMAIYLQDPFENKPTDTPVTAIAQTIERDIRQMMNSDHPTNSPIKTRAAKPLHSADYELETSYYVL